MSPISQLILLCLVPILIIFFEIIFRRRKRYYALPPGPGLIWCLGNLKELLASPDKHVIMSELSKKYGDIMTVWFLHKPVIILSSTDAVRKAYIEKQTEFASRPDSVLEPLLFGGYNLDVAFGLYSKRWLSKRRLMHSSIRRLACGGHLENETIAVLGQVIEKMLRDGDGQPVDLQHYLLQTIYSMVMILVFGKRFDLDDPEFALFCDLHNVDQEAIEASQFYDFLPFVQRLPFVLESLSPTMRRMKRAIGLYRGYLRKWYNETEYDEDGRIEYMTQAFKKGVDDMEKIDDDDNDQSEGGSISGQQQRRQIFSDKEQMAMLMNLYLGATSTMASSLSWLFLEVIIHPDIQEKCREELSNAVGWDRPVSLNDRPNLPYIEACILETLRFHTTASLNMPHTAHADAVLGEYKIPAGTDTIANLWAIHHDPKLWKNADRFEPDNFLDGEVDSGGGGRGRKLLLLRPNHYFPFGAGRRGCVGEAFAKNGMFLAFAVMMQRLRFEPVPSFEYTLERSETSGQFVNVPKSFIVSIRPR